MTGHRGGRFIRGALVGIAATYYGMSRPQVFPPTRSYAIKPLVPTYWDQVRPYLDFPSWFRGGPTHAQPPPSTRDGKVGVHADLQTTEHYPLAFALVGADLKSGTAFSWCGDCVKGFPVVDSMFELTSSQGMNGAPLFTHFISRNDWNAQHPMRQASHPLHCTNIPTLYRLEYGQVTGKLVEAECRDEGKVRSFITSSQKK